MNKNNPKCRNCKERFNKTDPKNPYCKKKECQKVHRDIVNEKLYQKAMKNLNKIKNQNKIWKQELTEEKAKKKNKNTLSNLKINVRTVCHEYIRLRDKGKPCVSCDKEWDSSFQAGHLYKAELYSLLKYDERNIHGQCQGCNLQKNGNESSYHLNIFSRISEEDYNDIKEIAAQEKKTNFKWDREELNKIREYYKQKIKNHSSAQLTDHHNNK